MAAAVAANPPDAAGPPGFFLGPEIAFKALLSVRAARNAPWAALVDASGHIEDASTAALEVAADDADAHAAASGSVGNAAVVSRRPLCFLDVVAAAAAPAVPDGAAPTYTCVLQLLDVLFDRPGLSTGTRDVRLEVVYAGNLEKHYPALLDVPLKEGSACRYKLRHESHVYLRLRAVVRAALLACSAFAFSRWRAETLRVYPSGACGACAWIPERQYIGLLLVGCLLIQDPLMLVVELHPAKDPVAPSVLLACNVIEGIGQQLVWLALLLLVDGLRLSAKFVRSSAAGAADNAAYRGGDGAGVAFLHAGRPPHHVLSPYACDFVFFKLAWFALTVAAVCVLNSVRFPDSPGADADADLDRLYLCMDALLMLVMAVWGCWVARATIRTGQALKYESCV